MHCASNVIQPEEGRAVDEVHALKWLTMVVGWDSAAESSSEWLEYGGKLGNGSTPWTVDRSAEEEKNSPADEWATFAGCKQGGCEVGGLGILGSGLEEADDDDAHVTGCR